MTLDFAHFSTRPSPGGWSTRCKDCHRETRQRTPEDVAEWQAAHTCSPEAVAAVTRLNAERILARMTPDDIGVVLARRAEAVAEAGAWRSRKGVA